ncbi:MAG TPA: Ig-like domain-containing protein [Chitinophagales bacterium]|nr:Ig-like domain-containing protein [Chitinophagales bacterium]
MKSTIKTFALVALLISAIAVTIGSCSKKTENQPPVVNLEEPAANETFALSDSVHIEGTVTDDESLHEMSVVVTNATGNKVFEQYPTVHELTTYSFHYHFHPGTAGTYNLEVTAEDHDGERATATRAFVVAQ